MTHETYPPVSPAGEKTLAWVSWALLLLAATLAPVIAATDGDVAKWLGVAAAVLGSIGGAMKAAIRSHKEIKATPKATK